MSKTLYMVIENFRNGDAVPVYRRFRDRGRLAPTGLSYVSSWVSDKLDRCYQLMEQKIVRSSINGSRIGLTLLTSKCMPSSAQQKRPRELLRDSRVRQFSRSTRRCRGFIRSRGRRRSRCGRPAVCGRESCHVESMFGCLTSPLIALLIFVGRLLLDVHGMAAVMLSEVIWFVGIGVGLMRREEAVSGGIN